MRFLKTAAPLALIAMMASCSWKRTPVPVTSDSGSVAALVGQWEGEYSSAETGRSGSITFQLASQKDTAYGDVIMVPRKQDVQTGPEERAQVMAARAPAIAEPLKIRFVRMEGGHVFGTLEPYREPDCGCEVTTTFEGRFSDTNTIRGTFITRGIRITHQPTQGRWTVARTAPVGRFP